MRTLAALLTVVLAASLPSPGRAAGERYPFPQHVAYAAGTLVPSHRTQTQLDGDVVAAYWRWKASYVVPAGTEPDGHRATGSAAAPRRARTRSPRARATG